MRPVLQTFLRAHAPLAEETTAWDGGRIPLRATAYLSGTLPPARYTTSARCLLVRGRSVLLCRNRDGVHILPGGRLERGESSEAALRREVLEETGWALASVAPFGFLHYRHLGPLPPGYRRLWYPDFFQAVFRATPDRWTPGAKLPDDYEVESRFRSAAAVRRLDLRACEVAFLDALAA